jgi:hypothetical protein
METIRRFEPQVKFYQTTRSHIQEDSILRSHCCEGLTGGDVFENVTRSSECARACTLKAAQCS